MKNQNEEIQQLMKGTQLETIKEENLEESRTSSMTSQYFEGFEILESPGESIMETRDSLDVELKEKREKVSKNMPKKYKYIDGMNDKAAELIANKRSFGMSDSAEMDLIKEKIYDVEQLMSDTTKDEYTISDIEEVLVKYGEAISACDVYLNNPKKRKTTTRYRLTLENKERLETEASRLEKAKELITDGKMKESGISLRYYIHKVEELPEDLRVSREETDRKEYENFHKQIPKFDEKAYEIYKKFQTFNAIQVSQEYVELFQKGVQNWTKFGGDPTYTRSAGSLMRPVRFDENGQPISKEDKKNHEWNLKWLRAWEDDDVETRENMIAEDFPHFMDKITVPEFTEEELNDVEKMQKRLQKWTDEMLDKDEFIYYYNASKRSLCIDSTKKVHPGIKKFMEDNPSFSIKTDCIDSIMQFVSGYMLAKYQFETATHIKVNTVPDGFDEQKAKNWDKNREANGKNLMLAYAVRMQEVIKAYKEVKDDPIVPYEKMRSSVKEEVKPEVKQEETESVLEKEKKKAKEAINSDMSAQEESFKKKLEEKKKKAAEKKRLAEEKERLDKLHEEEMNEQFTEDMTALQKEIEKEEEKVVTKSKRELKGKNKKRISGAESRKRVRAKEKAESKARKELLENVAKPVYDSMRSSMLKFVENEDFTYEEIYLPDVNKMMETTVAGKKAAARRMGILTTPIRDLKVKARRSVDIEDKKYMDYQTLKSLSEFAPLLKEGEFKEIAHLYNEGNKLYSMYDEDHRKTEAIKEKIELSKTLALNKITDKLMGIDPLGFDLTNDESLAKCSDKLEEVSMAATAYRDLLQKNPEYLDYLEKQKLQNGETMADQMMKQLDRLTALGEYYRLRKVIIEDELYQSIPEEEMTMEEKPGDNPQLARLKRMMRASYQTGVNLNRILNDEDLPDYDFKNEKGEYRDLLPLLTTGKLVVSTDKMEAYKKRLEQHRERNSIVNKIESEKYFQAPLWLQNALTLDASKIKDKCGKDAGFANGDSAVDFTRATIRMKTAGRGNLVDAYKKMSVEKTGNESFGSAPKFEGGKDEYLGSLEISDNWSRNHVHIANKYSYKMTDEEMLEMLDILSYQKDDKLKEERYDLDAMAYRESAYKEMAMKFIFVTYAGCRRVAETVSAKAMALHPIDLAMQMTSELRDEMFLNSVITNINTKDNMPRIEKLFLENNTENQYSFDMKSFKDFGDMGSNLNWKVLNIGNTLYNIAYNPQNEDQCEILFGDKNFFANTIDKEYNDFIKKGGKFEGWYGEKNGGLNEAKRVHWYFSRHPEYFTKEFFMKKDKDGEFIFKPNMSTCTQLMYNEIEIGTMNCIKEKKVDLPTDEEFDKYEEHLKKEQYPEIRNQCNYDSELEKEIIDPNEEIKINKNEKKKYKKKIVLDNRKKDPYGVKLIKTGMKELEYVADDGKKYIRWGLGSI